MGWKPSNVGCTKWYGNGGAGPIAEGGIVGFSGFLLHGRGIRVGVGQFMFGDGTDLLGSSEVLNCGNV